MGVLSARYPARPRRLLPWWLVDATVRELVSHFSPVPFLWSLRHSGVHGQGAGGDLPIGLFPLSALGLPCLRSGGGGQGRQCLAGPSILRDAGLVPVQGSSPLMILGVVTTFPVCLPRAPALRQVLVAVLAEGALESPSVLVLAFHSSLFLVGGSSDGSAPGDRFLSPGRMCLIHSVSVGFSRFCAVSTGEWLFFLLWICRCYCRIQWRRPSRKLLRFP